MLLGAMWHASCSKRAVMHRLLVALAVAGIGLAPAPVHACGVSAVPTYTISEVFPHPGESGVARDAGIVVTGIPSVLPAPWTFQADVQLLDDATGARVALLS